MCTFRLLTHIFLYSWLINSICLRNTLFTSFSRKYTFNIIMVSIFLRIIITSRQPRCLLVSKTRAILTGSNVTWASCRGGVGVRIPCVDILCELTLCPLSLVFLCHFSYSSLFRSHSFSVLPRFNSTPLAPPPPHCPFLVSLK